MRNIYFVKFGNYDGEKVTDKMMFPVATTSTLSIATAEEKLSHLKGILKKNCVIFIYDDVVCEKFTEIYNLETGTLSSYDVSYILIRCIERDISTEKFATFEEARKKMIQEVLDAIKDDGDLVNKYYEYCETNGNYDGDELGIYKSTAWANAEYGDNYDWRIIVC